MDDAAFAAIQTLRSMKYTFHGGEAWKAPLGAIREEPLSRIASALERIAATMERAMEMDCEATGKHT